MLYPLKDYLLFKNKIKEKDVDSKDPLKGIDLSRYVLSFKQETTSSRLQLVQITEAKDLDKKVSKKGQKVLGLDKYLKSQQEEKLNALVVDFGEKRLGQKKSLLFHALAAGDVEMAKDLFELGGASERYDNGMPAAFYALKKGHKDVFEWIISSHSEVLDQVWSEDRDGNKNPFFTKKQDLFLFAAENSPEFLDLIFEKKPEYFREHLFEYFISFTLGHCGFDEKLSAKILDGIRWFHAKDPELLSKFKDKFLKYTQESCEKGTELLLSKYGFQFNGHFHRGKSLQIPLDETEEIDPLARELIPACSFLTSSSLFTNKEIIDWVNSVDPSFYEAFLVSDSDTLFQKMLIRSEKLSPGALTFYLKGHPKFFDHVSGRVLVIYCEGIANQTKVKKNTRFDVDFAKKLLEHCKQNDKKLLLSRIYTPERFFSFLLKVKNKEEAIKWLVETGVFSVNPDKLASIFLSDRELFENLLYHPLILQLLTRSDYDSTLLTHLSPEDIQSYRRVKEKILEGIIFEREADSTDERPLVDQYNEKILYPRDLTDFSEGCLRLQRIFSSLTEHDFSASMHLASEREYRPDEISALREQKLSRARELVENIRVEKVDVAIPGGEERKYYDYLKKILCHLAIYLENLPPQTQKAEAMTFLEDLIDSSGACYANFSARLLSVYKRVASEGSESEIIELDEPEKALEIEFMKALSSAFKRQSAIKLLNSNSHLSALYKDYFEFYHVPHIDIPRISDREIHRRPILKILCQVNNFPFVETDSTQEIQNKVFEIMYNQQKNRIFSLGGFAKNIKTFLQTRMNKSDNGLFIQQVIDFVSYHKSQTGIDDKFFQAHELFEFDDETQKTTLKENAEYALLSIFMTQKNLIIRS